MKRYSFVLFFIVIFSMLSVLAKDETGMLRQRKFNEGWKFNLDGEITIAIEGNAMLIGLDSGDQYSHEKYKTNSRKAYNGRLLATVQTTNASGEIKISCSAKGLEPTTLKINSLKKSLNSSL